MSDPKISNHRAGAWGLIGLVSIPLLLTCMSLISRPPYYTFVDPDLAYFSTAVSIHVKGGINHIDHPGTPYQLFLASALAPLRLFNGSLRPPASFLEYSYHNVGGIMTYFQILGGILMSLGVFLWGMGVKKLTGSGILGAFIGMGTLLLLPQGMNDNILRVRPEVMVLFLAGAWMYLFGLAWGMEPGPGWVAVFGFQFMAGFCMAAKLTSFPLALFGTLFTLVSIRDTAPGGRKRILIIIALFMGPVIGFLIGILPVLSKFIEHLSWLSGVFTHQGNYGSGAMGVPVESWRMGIKQALKSSAPIIGALVLLCAGYFLRFAGAQGKRGRVTKLFACGLAAAFISYIPLSRQFAAHYYLGPDLLLFLLIAVFLVKISEQANSFWRTLTGCSLAILASIMIFTGSRSLNALVRYREYYDYLIRSKLEDAERKGKIIVYTYYSMNPESALFGAGHLSRDLFGVQLYRDFPNHRMWNHWNDILFDYSGRYETLTRTNWDYLLMNPESFREYFLSRFPDSRHEIFYQGRDGTLILKNLEKP